MKIGIAADHGGYALKEIIRNQLEAQGHELSDFGAHTLDRDDDYPDFVLPLARAVADTTVERGIAICGSGVGAAIAANKVAGVRASLVAEHFSAHQGVEDDDLNLLCLGGRVTGESAALELVGTFINAQFSGAERHRRRLEKIQRVENNSGL
ncbi:RpiB/LacA/LacB family sugar-phosphate isomerase [Taibaiella koreensis]|uniref:RpiB/LacA/LacB family sugar-phosphate isomerase n=1 Tax=Taibaiella koreensis TaxID=1268548 RepID=UPI000E59D63A|nr:RpiB/LacA/LacB family sugar-phosphate isomerase [Taibaiella koreensis]